MLPLRKVWCVAVISVALWGLNGCSSPPPHNLHAASQPADVERDNVHWVAGKLAGDNDEWAFVPLQVQVLAESKEVAKVMPLKVIIGGREWEVTADGVGNYDAGTPRMLLMLVLGGGCVVLAVVNARLQSDLAVERRKSATLSMVEPQLRDEFQERREQLERNHSARQKELAQQSQLALTQSIQTIRQQAEERYRATVTAANLQERDERLREAHLMFSRTGRVVSVRVLAAPTGWIAIEWSLDPSLQYPLKVVGIRDGKHVFVEHAFKSLYSDVLVRGREYTFEIHAYEGTIDREGDFSFVFQVPSLEQWQRNVSDGQPVDQTNERDRRIKKKIREITTEDAMWQQARREGHARIDSSEGTEMDKMRRKASLDAKLAEERDRQ